MDINEINHLLVRQYGVRQWHQHHDPLSELIAVILSQNTSDTNSMRAYNALIHTYSSWQEVMTAKVDDIERTIHSGGLARIKAARIKEILHTIKRQQGTLNLDSLNDLSVDEATAWLSKLPGVGPKTVACVLLFALNKPVFPVDTHVLRVSKRLGLISGKVTANKAHEIMRSMIPAENTYQLHMNMVEHGRKTCRAQSPKCSDCILKEMCPSTK